MKMMDVLAVVFSVMVLLAIGFEIWFKLALVDALLSGVCR